MIFNLCQNKMQHDEAKTTTANWILKQNEGKFCATLSRIINILTLEGLRGEALTVGGFDQGSGLREDGSEAG